MNTPRSSRPHHRFDRAAANAVSLLSKQILDGERRIKSVPRRDRAEARNEVLRATVSGYQVVRFLFRLDDPRLSGNDPPAATQANMTRIMNRGQAYVDQEMAEVMRCTRVRAHAIDHARPLRPERCPMGRLR